MLPPRGIVTKSLYDNAGRVTKEIEAYDSGVNGGLPTSSANQTVEYAYSPLDQVSTLRAVLPGGAYQGGRQRGHH